MKSVSTYEGESNMKFVIQRVTQAKVTVDDTVVGRINKGFLVFIGVGENDTKEDADHLIRKMIHLSISIHLIC